MTDWMFQLWVSLEPDHPKFGAVHHRMRGLGYAYAKSLDEARSAIRKHCADEKYRIEEEMKSGRPEEVANVDHPLTQIQIQKARRFGVALETIAVETKPSRN